jgi:hypothetical protein
MQLVVGALFGALSSCLFNARVYFTVYPHIDRCHEFRACRWFGWRRGVLEIANYTNEDDANEFKLPTSPSNDARRVK